MLFQELTMQIIGCVYGHIIRWVWAFWKRCMKKQVTSEMTQLHFAPTSEKKQNLLKEGFQKIAYQLLAIL